jgi:hypothetical protein
MNDVCSFIHDGLKNFSDDGGIYDVDLKGDCLILNDMLNKIQDDEYQKHLTANSSKIMGRAEILFIKMQSDTYTNLQDLFNLLFFYQDDKEIQDPHDSQRDIRDHYFHSLQCFLLSIALYPTLSKQTDLKPEVSYLTGTLFSLSIYHDIGYLYKAKSKRINNLMQHLFFNDNELNRSTIFRILFIVLKNIVPINQEESKTRLLLDRIREIPELKIIWENDLNSRDILNLYEIARINVFPPDHQQHHSFMSAVLLERILQTIRTIRQYFDGSNLPGIISINNPDSIIERKFVDVIRAILLHDFQMHEEITLKDDFLASFLMIIDGLQTYGRLPQNAIIGKEVLNPKYVGFQWLNSHEKLLLSYDKEFVIAQSNSGLTGAYRKHDNKEIIKSLANNVNMNSLEFLNIEK